MVVAFLRVYCFATFGCLSFLRYVFFVCVCLLFPVCFVARPFYCVFIFDVVRVPIVCFAVHVVLFLFVAFLCVYCVVVFVVCVSCCCVYTCVVCVRPSIGFVVLFSRVWFVLFVCVSSLLVCFVLYLF